MVQESTVTVYDEWTEWRNKEGEYHRLDGPAVECSNGTKSWWVNGQPHRIDGPAFEWSNGTKAWWVNGNSLTEEDFNRKVSHVNSLVEEISNLLGYDVKIVKS